MLDESIKQDFPILNQRIHDHPLVYLDSAASAQKPQVVMDTINQFYQTDYANIHRGVHTLSDRATNLYEQARQRIALFIHAASHEEIAFVRGTTEAINLLANGLGRDWGPEDEVLISEMEHHSNIIPWQLVQARCGVKLKIIPVLASGDLDLDSVDALLTEKTKLLALVHVSNTLGTVNPVKLLIDKAHAQGVPVLLDGAQAVPHFAVDVQALDCDYYVFSGHKLYGPTGIGVFYGKQALLAELPPYQGGGGMIQEVHFSGSTYAQAPYRFEAGTPNIAGAVGLHAALDYLDNIGFDALIAHEQTLLHYALEQLATVPGIRIFPGGKHQVSVISFILEGIHGHDVGSILDHSGVAVRAGHHCTMPLIEKLGVPVTVRASLGLYNTLADVDSLVCGLHEVNKVFG